MLPMGQPPSPAPTVRAGRPRTSWPGPATRCSYRPDREKALRLITLDQIKGGLTRGPVLEELKHDERPRSA